MAKPYLDNSGHRLFLAAREFLVRGSTYSFFYSSESHPPLIKSEPIDTSSIHKAKTPEDEPTFVKSND